jgi:hypothetical protein
MENLYLLDTNVFIQAKNFYYAFDIAPSFWEKLNQLAKDNVFSIIDHVKRELTKSRDNPDDIHLWIKEEYSGEVLSTNDQLVVNKYTEITEKVQSDHKRDKHYQSSAIQKFLEFENADTWLISYALAYNCKIVTFEKYSSDAKKSVKIPNVCKLFSIDYLDLYQFMREVGMTL